VISFSPIHNLIRDERYRTMNYLQVPPRSSDSWRISLLHPHIQTNAFRFRCDRCLAIQDIHLTTDIPAEQERFNEAHKHCSAVRQDDPPQYFLANRGHMK